jgi:acetolactate synthase-1/3 small subunit
MQHLTHILTLDVRDVPGVLVRVAHVFARRGYSIRSLHVEPRSNGWSTMTITVHDIVRIDQIIHQLEKLVDVQRVTVREATPKEATPHEQRGQTNATRSGL